MPLVPPVRDNDWVQVRKNFQKLGSSLLGKQAYPIHAGLTLTGLTDNSIIYTTSGVLTSLGAATNGQIPIGSTGAIPVLAGITGTANQITVTNGAGSITLSTPQNIHAGATDFEVAGLKVTNKITEFSTDGTMGGNSDSAVPTEKATKLYTDTLRSDLASVANAKGASLVGVEDSAAQFDATNVETALSELMVLVTPVEYNPTMTRTVGGDAGGNDDSVATIDDADSYDTDEVGGTPGFDIQAVFSGVVDFNQVQIHTAYDGNPAHVVRIDLDKTPFDWSSYDTILADIDDSSGNFIFNAITVASAASYINSGEVRLRFYHSSAGNATHDFFIDYCALWKTGVSVGVTEHGGLTGLDDVSDHPSYLLLDGSRALAGAWDMGSQALTNVNIDSGVITGITDLAIADGGTGQSTAQTAINALSAVSGATNEHVLTKDTGTGNAIWKVAAGGGGSPGGNDSYIQYNNGGAFGGDSRLVWSDTAGQGRLTISTIDAGIGYGLYIAEVGSSTVLTSSVCTVIGSSPPLSQFQCVQTGASSNIGGGGIVAAHDDGAAMANGDRLGYVLFGGSISGSFSNAAGIVAYADGNWTSGVSHPAKFQFETITAGGTSRTAKLIINNNGNVSVFGIISPCVGNYQQDTEKLRLCRADSPAFRYSSIYSRTDGVATGNSITFKVHNAVTGTSQSDVLILRGDGKVGIGVVPKTLLTVEGALTLKEQAAADSDVPAYGQIWVKTATPNELWFTDDGGTDHQIAYV